MTKRQKKTLNIPRVTLELSRMVNKERKNLKLYSCTHCFGGCDSDLAFHNSICKGQATFREDKKNK